MVQEQEIGAQGQDESRAEHSNAESSTSNAIEVFVKSSQMSEAFQSAAVAIAAKALAAYTHTSAIDLKQVATEIKQEYDKQYPSDGKATDGVYYCVVGESFACEFVVCFDVFVMVF